jgi:hypothetical protein
LLKCKKRLIKFINKRIKGMYKLIFLRPNQKTDPKTLNLKGVLNNYTYKWRNRQTEREGKTDRQAH